MSDEFGPATPLDITQEDIANMWGILGQNKPVQWPDLKYKALKTSPADMLQDAANTFKLRNELYGDNYKKFGHIMKILNPTWECNVENWNRVCLLVQIVSKLTRYCENFNKGGHDDSLNDLAVYAAILRSLDKEINEVPF
jgi:hypothetical protein